ncbi:MAG: sulfate transporter family protein [Alphaproteobacteria bacterium]|nr:sulfate transporter family protein [Alphaproteobacteria bacterium]
MLENAIKALTQILSPPMRSILWRSIGLALLLVFGVAIALQRLLSFFANSGETWLETTLGPNSHTSLEALSWVLSISSLFGILFGGFLLMPAITSLVASFFVDEVAQHVESDRYPTDPPGTALPFLRAITEGSRTALLAVLVYLFASPFVLFAGAGFLIFFLATAWLLGREYFLLAAMRFRLPGDARALRKENASTIFAAGALIAGFCSIPIVNLATPIFGMAFMVHMHKQLSAPPSRTAIQPAGFLEGR